MTAEGVGDLGDLLSGGGVAVFTGAGISTESGIPDFRSPGGVWDRYAPIDFRDFMMSDEMRKESWRRKFEVDKTVSKAKPNRGHEALAALVGGGLADCVITQNVDNLHQESGISPDKVIELHGNGTYAKCLSCGERMELEEARRIFEKEGKTPYCGVCAGVVKSATISFGQAMPEREVDQARRAALGCRVFLVVGTSLVVYPAAALPEEASRAGATLAIVNREPTDMDVLAKLTLRGEAGEILEAAVKRALG